MFFRFYPLMFWIYVCVFDFIYVYFWVWLVKFLHLGPGIQVPDSGSRTPGPGLRVPDPGPESQVPDSRIHLSVLYKQNQTTSRYLSDSTYPCLEFSLYTFIFEYK